MVMVGLGDCSLHWIKFFLAGVIQTAETSVATLKKIIDLKSNIEKNYIYGMGKRTKIGMDFFHFLFQRPIVQIKDVEKFTRLSKKASYDLVDIFVKKKILVEITGNQRNRIFSFKDYIDLF